MPVKWFNLGIVSASSDVGPTPLIPGVEPGGSRAGDATKPALLIKDCWAMLRDLTDAGTTANFENIAVYLKLSQEDDLDPGLILPVAIVTAQKTGTANLWNDVNVVDMFRAQGTLWAPRVVGVRFENIGTAMDSWDIDVYLDYEVVDVPWMDWFIMWEFLDGVVNDSQDY